MRHFKWKIPRSKTLMNKSAEEIFVVFYPKHDMARSAIAWLDILPIRAIFSFLDFLRASFTFIMANLLLWSGIDLENVKKFLPKNVQEHASKIDSTAIPKLNWSFFKGLFEVLFIGGMRRKASRGKSAPNPTVYDSITLEKRRLLDHSRPGVPFVVLFGSCTCPIFVNTARKKLQPLIEKKGDSIDFVLVYQEEAHSSDGFWPHKGNEFQLMKPRSLVDRQSASKVMKEFLPCRILLDGMDNQASIDYSGMPHRIAIILDGHVHHLSGKALGFDIEATKRSLDKLC